MINSFPCFLHEQQPAVVLVRFHCWLGKSLVRCNFSLWREIIESVQPNHLWSSQCKLNTMTCLSPSLLRSFLSCIYTFLLPLTHNLFKYLKNIFNIFNILIMGIRNCYVVITVTLTVLCKAVYRPFLNGLVQKAKDFDCVYLLSHNNIN